MCSCFDKHGCSTGPSHTNPIFDFGFCRIVFCYPTGTHFVQHFTCKFYRVFEGRVKNVCVSIDFLCLKAKIKV